MSYEDEDAPQDLIGGPKYWVFGVRDTLTPPMQKYLWSAYTDLVSVAVPDTAPPASKVWSLTLGRRVFANDDVGQSSRDAEAGSRKTSVTRGTLQHQASTPAARAAALRFMATLDLLLGGAGEGPGRIADGIFTPKRKGPSPAKSWGGWGDNGGLRGSLRDMCAHVDFASMHTAQVMQCVPGADGSSEIDPEEIQAAIDAVRTRCAVPRNTDIMPFRLAGLGTCVTIEVGSDDEPRLPEGYDEGYTFFLNLRPPDKMGTVLFNLPQLNTAIHLSSGNAIALRAAVQVHVVTDGDDDDDEPRKKKNKKKKKKRKAITAQADDQEDDDAWDSDVDALADSMQQTLVAGSSAGPSSSVAGSSLHAASAHAGRSSTTAGSSHLASSHAGPSQAGPSHASSSREGLSSWTSPAGSSSAAGSSSLAGQTSSAGPSSRRETPQASSSAVATSQPVSHPIATSLNQTPRILVTIWTDIETVANVAMAAKMVWPELEITGIETPPPSPPMSPVSGKRPIRGSNR